MNVIGTCLERCDENSYFVEFKTKNPDKADDKYEWKCWMLKKYFHDNAVVNFIRIPVGIFMLVLVASSNSALNHLSNNRLRAIFAILLLSLGVIMVGTGIIFSIFNNNCKKHYSDYLWDDEAEGEDNIATKIIQYYKKR